MKRRSVTKRVELQVCCLSILKFRDQIKLDQKLKSLELVPFFSTQLLSNLEVCEVSATDPNSSYITLAQYNPDCPAFSPYCLRLSGHGISN